MILFTYSPNSVIVSEDGGIQGILWTYPVHGIPEAPQQKLVPGR